tara:strand:- start:4747 stop:5172 length:426 start_codon:yes stop_codon:yes gene_type:complete
MDLIDKDQTAHNDYTFSSPIMQNESLLNINLNLDSKIVDPKRVEAESVLFGINKPDADNTKLFNENKIKPIIVTAPVNNVEFDIPTRVSKECANKTEYQYVTHPSYVGANINTKNLVSADMIEGVSTRNQMRDESGKCVND